MEARADYFARRIEHLVEWQQYLQAKWTSTLFESFRDVKGVWRLAGQGTPEERSRIDEKLSDHFYTTVAPAVFKLFGDEIIANYTWDDFSAAVFEVSGIDIDRDWLVRSKEMKEIAPGIEEWAKA